MSWIGRAWMHARWTASTRAAGACTSTLTSAWTAARASRSARLVSLLGELGFDPELRVSADRQQIGLHHCPFLELAQERAQVVCPIHLGLMQGAMAAWDAPVTVNRLEPFAEPDLCVAHLALTGADS